MATQSSLIENRMIRVFISSTFEDLQDERTELIRKTFPRLMEIAAQRDVTLTEVDLRWGITPEEKQRGKVMEICLREVENSIPFFIGIIGNRYGWVPGPEDVSDIVKERFPKVPHYVERQLSATEIEMQFGVLNRTDVDMNAYFFIKEKEVPENEILKRYPTETPETLKKLAELKKAVRENKKYPVSTYKDPEDLADQVLAAFTKLLDDLFPVGELSALEKERLGQRAVLNNLSRVYIKTESNFAVIDKWMEDWEKHQLVITGASGLGKSALVANWIKGKLKLGEELPYRIIYHFVGYGGSVGSDWHVVKALCDEIRDRYEFDVDESEPKTDEKALDDLFKRVAVEGDKPLLIVLDGINQIIDVNYAKRLNWLPIPPKKVKILFTTLEDDETMQVFKDRHYPVFTLRPLTKDERIDMVRRYLDKTYRKHLEDAQLERIVDDPQNENTLVLKTLLDEIANFGSFEKLDEKIEEYLKPDSIGDFYQAVLQNYEADFGKELVRHFLSLIAVSRNGLSEDEILEITGIKDKPFLWYQFFCSFRQHMVVKNGLISFSHNYIREAVEERYINGRDEWVRACREEIVAYLENQKTPDGEKTTRSMEELPHQYIKLNDLGRLYQYLMNLSIFIYLYKTDEDCILRCWRKLVKHGYSMRDYLCHLDKEDRERTVYFLSELHECAWQFTLSPTPSSIFLEHRLCLELDILNAYKRLFGDEHPEVVKMYDWIGNTYSLMDDNQKALQFFNGSLEIKKRVFGGKHSEVASSFENLANTYLTLGDTDRALELAKKALTIYSNLFLSIKGRLAQNLEEITSIYAESGNHQEELKWELKLLDFREKEYGANDERVANSYHNIGYIYEKEDDYQSALKYHLKSLDILFPLLGKKNTDVERVLEAYLDIADVFGRLGEKEKENEYFKCVFSITENKALIASLFCMRGSDYKLIGDTNKAKEYFDKAFEIYLELGDLDAINYVLEQSSKMDVS